MELPICDACAVRACPTCETLTHVVLALFAASLVAGIIYQAVRTERAISGRDD